MPGPLNVDALNELASRPSPGVLAALETVDSDILVVGAGGKMGFHLACMLQRGLSKLNSRHRVIAVSRFGRSGATDAFHQHGIETISVDLTEPGAIVRLPESGNVFYLAGVKFGSSGNPDLLQQMNVELPARVARRFPLARIVALSTGCVYSFSTPASGGSIEADPLDPPGEYARSCVGREQAFADSKASLIRLNYSVDLRYGVLVDIAQKVLHDRPIDVSTGFANVIWQGDANGYIVQSLTRAVSPPFAINVTGKTILRIGDVARRFGKLFDRKVSSVGTEKETAWLSNANACFELWGLPSVDEDRLIEWVAEWLKKGGETLDKPTHFEVRDGKY